MMRAPDNSSVNDIAFSVRGGIIWYLALSDALTGS